MTTENVTESLEAAIQALADRAKVETVADYAASFGYAANQLAEARAWLKTASQPHGGSAAPSKG